MAWYLLVGAGLESASPLRLFLLALILAGIVGLQAIEA
jgi:multidrug transporter EmrE-like cation transporter